MSREFVSSPAIPALLAGVAMVAMAGVAIFAVSDNETWAFSSGTSRASKLSSAVTGDDDSPTGVDHSAWLWAVAAAGGLYLMYRHFRRLKQPMVPASGALGEGTAVEPMRMQSADQLRDALAIFNREAFNCAEMSNDLVSLYRAFVSARVELQKGNARLMYDAIGASHIKSVQQMLTEMDDDFTRHWPALSSALKNSAGTAADLAATSQYNEALTYLRELRNEIREELVHAELRYRRLLPANRH